MKVIFFDLLDIYSIVNFVLKYIRFTYIVQYLQILELCLIFCSYFTPLKAPELSCNNDKLVKICPYYTQHCATTSTFSTYCHYEILYSFQFRETLAILNILGKLRGVQYLRLAGKKIVNKPKAKLCLICNNCVTSQFVIAVTL